MKAEQLQLALRPRPVYEAVDLGVRMTQQAAASLRHGYLPLALLLVLACGSTVELAPWLPSLLLWWLKPWLDRALLHVYARQVFGEQTSFSEVWSARQRAPWAPLARMLSVARLSPWRACALPVAQLEGQSGGARRRRLQVLLRGQHRAATLTISAFSWVETILTLGLVSLLAWLRPGQVGIEWLRFLGNGELAGTLLLYLAYAAAVLFVEPFYVAAGFAMYLNRRVELEAWDVEQDLRDAFDHR